MTTAFQEASPYKMARRYVDAELADRATAQQIAWLYEHPMLWLRALQAVVREVESHLAKSRASLARIKPPPGTAENAEYMAAKNEVDTRSVSRIHVLNLAKGRVEEVKALLGPESAAMGHLSMGDLIAIMTDIAGLADEGDLANAADKAMFWARKWQQGQGQGQR